MLEFQTDLAKCRFNMEALSWCVQIWVQCSISKLVCTNVNAIKQPQPDAITPSSSKLVCPNVDVIYHYQTDVAIRGNSITASKWCGQMWGNVATSDVWPNLGSV
ncbi:hypothetical protein CEXT_543501 [Caerostris extrusa]|uniref:Uncharacterized protein n=1 Tax=Caerostris extrusa TaxID=172846 RepID=A0AAV4VH44_CAEEX|nr:hypothetical protein CEXT_543501 [Caerostris extrusa]